MSERARRDRGPSRASRLGAILAAGGLLVAAACGGDGTTGPSPSVKAVDLDLSVGQSQRITADQSVLRVNVPGPGGDGAEYRLAVQSAAESPGVTVLRLGVDAGDESASASVSARRQATPRRDVPGGGDLPGYGIRSELQRRALEMLQREGIRPADGDRGVRTRTMLPTGQEPSEGDELEFWFPDIEADGSIVCDTTAAEKVTATVQAVNDGGEVAIVEGNEVDDGGGIAGGMDYGALADEFDETVFGTDVAYFGTPSDIDDNQRVLVLFTNKVNEFSAERTDGDDDAFVGGFFLGTDLADSGDDTKDGAGSVCEASNEAEVLWLLAPDPDGSTGERAFDVQQATRQARSTASHEFQHLLNLGNRLFEGGGGFGDAEETWLNEGLSHVAEEIVGLDQSGAVLRDNLELSDVTGSPSQDSIFNTFLISDFANLARHLQATAQTTALAESSPQGADASLRMRGFSWAFLRWLADRVHAGQAGSTPGSGDPEEQFFRELSGADGSLETGLANIEAATGEAWPVLLADFGLAMVVDDEEPQAADERQVLSWHLRDVYRGLNQGTDGASPFDREYPLVPTPIGFSPASFDFEVEAGTGRYFTLSSGGSGPDVTLELSDQTGGELTSGSPQITIIRTE